MARIVNLQKDVEHISWSDEPGAKTYEIDFTDGGLTCMKEKLETLNDKLSTMTENPENAARAIEEFVCTVAGSECYADACAYVDTKGTGKHEHIMTLLPLVYALAEIVMERLTTAKSAAIGNYLKETHASTDLI